MCDNVGCCNVINSYFVCILCPPLPSLHPSDCYEILYITFILNDSEQSQFVTERERERVGEESQVWRGELTPWPVQ